jgi:catecholate siderophore receptor
MNKSLLRTSLAVLVLANTGRLLAQTAAEPAKDDILVLDPYKIESGVAPEQLILPIARPFNSVFGTDDNIVDVPRNVTIISRQQLSDISIESVLDFSKLTSSAFTTTNFGAPANPSIRGQSADMFVNGVRARITSNGNGLPVDFNAVESVNIVKGPATAVQGSSMYVGGFVDLITKRPYFDKFKGSISYTIGSYNTNKWTVDVGGPLSKETAYRFSYSGEDSKGYYTDGFKKTHSLYGALSFRPNDHYEMFFTVQYSDLRYTENWGMNRVTQNLIDKGLYTTGTNINNGTAASASDPQNSNNVGDGFNVIAWGPEVEINRHLRLLKPGDHSKGEEFVLQAIQTNKLSADLTLKNTSYFNHTARNTLSSYYYSEIIDPSWFAENRTEFIVNKPKYTANVGLDLRYQRTKAYDDYFFEPANVWDLTKDHAYINVHNSPSFYGRFVGQPVPGWPNRYATQGVINGDTNDSKGTTIGPFVQTTYKIDSKWSLILGARYDFIRADVKEPLPPIPAEDSISVANPNVNGSLSYKPTETSSVYFTYNYSENTSGAVGNGGGITGWDSGASGTYHLDKPRFQQPSSLYELGTKYALMNNRLFLNFALYNQKRTAKSTSSTAIQKFETNGFEAEMNFQPNKLVYLTLSYSYADAEFTYTGDYPFFGGDLEVPPGNKAGYAPAAGSILQVPGLPQHLFNGLISYNFDNGWAVSANTVITGEINHNASGSLVIPWQYTIDASTTYKRKNWEYRLSVTNLTNEKNWIPSVGIYGNGSIMAMSGTMLQLTAKLNF